MVRSGAEFHRGAKKVAAFREIALQTKSPEAMREAFSLIPYYRLFETDLSAALLSLHAKRIHNRVLEPDTLRGLSSRYEQLVQAAGIDSEDDQINHVLLTEWFLSHDNPNPNKGKRRWLVKSGVSLVFASFLVFNNSPTLSLNQNDSQHNFPQDTNTQRVEESKSTVLAFVEEKKPPIEIVPRVIRSTRGKKFLIHDGTGLREVTVDQLKWADTPRLKWLGFDCAQPELIESMAKIGVEGVRIPIEQADEEFFINHPEVLEAIKMGKDLDMRLLLLFNPNELISPQETEKRVKRILGLVKGYKKVTLEIGNEPDLSFFWKGADLNTYAQFFKQTASIIWNEDPSLELMVAGASQKEAIPPLVRALKEKGVDFKKVIFGLHTYNDLAEIESRVRLLRSTAGEDVKFAFSELGWNQNQANKGEMLVRMAKKARVLGASYVFGFQWRDIPFDGTNGDLGRWGVGVDPFGRYLDHAWDVAQFISEGESLLISEGESLLISSQP